MRASFGKAAARWGYDAIKLIAACNSPYSAYDMQILPGGVANTAELIEIRYHEAGSISFVFGSGFIHVILIPIKFQKGVNSMQDTAVYPCGDTLVDIREIKVSTELPRKERIAEFVRQIGNPYLFRCGKFTVKASFAADGVTLEDCIKGILR